jgi:hypothetical protein
MPLLIEVGNAREGGAEIDTDRVTGEEFHAAMTR